MFEMIPWRERRELSNFRREMDTLFDRFLDGWPFRVSAGDGEWMPSVDVSETGYQVVVRAELPGMEPKEIDISIQGNVLTLRGERRQEKREDGENYHRIERSYGAFSRSVQLPAEVNPEKVDAVYQNGVLKISMPKTEASKPRKVEVRAGE